MGLVGPQRMLGCTLCVPEVTRPTEDSFREVLKLGQPLTHRSDAFKLPMHPLKAAAPKLRHGLCV